MDKYFVIKFKSSKYQSDSYLAYDPSEGGYYWLTTILFSEYLAYFSTETTALDFISTNRKAIRNLMVSEGWDDICLCTVELNEQESLKNLFSD